MYRCNGGHPVKALAGITKNKVSNQKAYSKGKYNGRQGSCAAVAAKELFTIPYWVYTFDGDEEILKFVLDEVKVSVAVAVHANDAFMSYRSGIFQDSRCPTDVKSMNHAVNSELSW